MNNQDKRNTAIAAYRKAIKEVLSTFEGYLTNLPPSDLKDYSDIPDIKNEITEYCNNLDIFVGDQDIQKYKFALHHKLTTLESWKVRISTVTNENNQLVRRYWNPTVETYNEFSEAVQNAKIEINWSRESFPPADVISQWLNQHL